MISKKVAQQIKELEIHTRRVLHGSQIGGQKSRQKGFGFEFDQLRNYQYGDDVRLIDWKSSARSSDGFFVRQYHEERNRTFMLCLDVSASTYFGSSDILKQDMMRQITGVLSLAAEYGKDKVGLILFSDHIEEMILPKKGRQHVHQLIEKIFSHTPKGTHTNLDVLLSHVAHKVDKNAVVFIVSDFISDNYEKSLKQAVLHKEIIAISCTDQQETDFKTMGLVWMFDPEQQEYVLIDTRKKKKQELDKILKYGLLYQKKILQKHRVDVVHVQSQKHFIHDLVVFFQKRLSY